MSAKKLHMAVWDYDRIQPLKDRTVVPNGLELEIQNIWIQEIFHRMLTKKEFDVSELSFGAYVNSLFQDDPSFVAIPVFPSRMFRHNSIYINTSSNIKSPEDIRGKKIGLPEYRQTAVVWIKGFLKDQYGLDYDQMTYHTGPLEKSGGKFFYNLSKTDVTKLHKDISVEPIPSGTTLSEMILKGELDVLYSALEPSTVKNFPDKVTRLFKDPKQMEIDYFRETSIFPIMHVIVIRKELYEQDKWIARSLYDAFLEAKNSVIDDLIEASGALKYSLPWMRDSLEETLSVMGRDYWPYGVSGNRKTLTKFVEYMYDQGVIPKPIDIKSLFAQEVVST